MCACDNVRCRQCDLLYDGVVCKAAQRVFDAVILHEYVSNDRLQEFGVIV